MESCISIERVCLRLLVILLCHQMLHVSGDAKTIVMNFNCSQDSVYFKCTTANLNISLSDKNSSFEFHEIPKVPQEIAIESSKMNFIPPEIFVIFTELKEFIAKNVSIQEIYFETFAHASKLYYLVLSQNEIQTLVDYSFRNASYLQSLKLYGNRIEMMSSQAFFGLTELRYLDLSNNRIVNLPLHLFRDLQSLEDLLLDRNFIKVISLYQFERNRDLVILSLENNGIVAIDSGTFDNFTKLERLNLNANVCVDKVFELFHADNLTELACCAKSIEEMKKCSGQKINESNQTKPTTHVPLILLLFVSIFGNFLAFAYCCIYKRRTNDGAPEAFELITDDMNGTAIEVY